MLYLVNDVEMDPVSQEQFVNVENAFEVAKAKEKAVALQEKYRGARVELTKKLEAEEEKAHSL